MLVRLALAAMAVPGQMWGDEPAYLRLGRTWAETGVYPGHWPPLYPWLIRTCQSLFGAPWEGMLRLLQIGLSVWTCGWAMAIARDTYGDRSARAAGWIFALYLPLAVLTHRVYAETLYLALLVPAIALTMRVQRGLAGARWLVAAGVLLGLAALTRDVGRVTWVAIAAAVLWGRVDGARGTDGPPVPTRPIGPTVVAAALALWGSLVLIPGMGESTSLRGKVHAAGGTATANLSVGLGPRPRNFETAHLGRDIDGPAGSLRRQLNAPLDGGGPPRPPVRTFTEAARFVVEEPTYVARTRLVRWADLVTPMNTALLSWSTDIYDQEAVPKPLRRTFIVASILAPIGLLLGALASILRAAIPRPFLDLTFAVGLVTLGTGLLTAQSRFRAPLEVLLIVLAAGVLQGRRRQPSPRVLGAVAFSLAALIFGWSIALPPLRQAILASW